MPIIKKTLIFILLFFTFLLTACLDEKKEPIEPKRVFLEGNASNENYNFAQIHFANGEYDKALVFHLKQLEEDLKYYGNKSLEIALNYNNIGLDYDELKNYEKASEYYLKAMKIDEVLLEDNSTERSTTYYNIASSYQALNQYHEAVEYYLKALALDELLLAPEHENILAEYEGLAISYGRVLKPRLSLKYWRKSLSYKERSYGKYSEDTNETREKVEELQSRLMIKIK